MTSPDLIRTTPEDKARSRVVNPWQDGTLFHNFERFPRKQEEMDRLDSILRNGVIPPGLDTTGSVLPDFNIIVGDISKYNRVVFLHRFSTVSWVYIPSRENMLTVFVDKDTPVLTPQDMGTSWPVTSLDEVYYDGIIFPENIAGIATTSDLDFIMESFGQRLQELGIPLYKMTGEVFWPK